MLGRARCLGAAGYSVLLFDFQAHGESPGPHITFGYLESKDARAAIEFLHSNAPGEKIGVLGVSLGGAAASLAKPPLTGDATKDKFTTSTTEGCIPKLFVSVHS